MTRVTQIGQPATVVVSTLHVPVGVLTSAGLFVVGVAFTLFCTSRYRRTSEQAWIVLSGAAVLIVLLSAAALVTAAVRHMH